jgi:hypothetical protein
MGSRTSGCKAHEGKECGRAGVEIESKPQTRDIEVSHASSQRPNPSPVLILFIAESPPHYAQAGKAETKPSIQWLYSPNRTLASSFEVS